MNGIKQDEIIKDSPIILLDDRIVISLSGDLLFASGKAELTEKARKALFNLGGVLRNIRNTIGIYGYSEDEKFDRDKYSSDWELSLARAVSVANELTRAGYMEEILSFGYGGARSFRLANVSKDRRQSLSRRVDIVIMSIRGLK